MFLLGARKSLLSLSGSSDVGPLGSKSMTSALVGP